MKRLRIHIQGAVQGVGFRPFVYRLASEFHLTGWVINNNQGVLIEAEGDAETLQHFLLRLEKEKPPRAAIYSLEHSLLDPVGYTAFEIRHSDSAGEKSVLVLPDIATCDECLAEIFDPANRRYRYPFTNCTNCGPRYTIIESLPYDRPNTTMKHFTMCPACQREYEDPADRRFHAQPNACPVCGPQLELWDARGNRIAEKDEALHLTAQKIVQGQIVAVKGLGGFHLMCDATDNEAVQRLRQRKRREEKPFAVMFPELSILRAYCVISPLEERLLRSPECPIVLLKRHLSTDIAGNVAPGNPYLGAFLPYTPLHHLLLAEIGRPVVATSGNLSDEPICIDEFEALERLQGIADWFLVHNRPILRHVDDSIVRIIAGREVILRRARGYAPLPIMIPRELPPTLAVGAHLKNTIAISRGRQVFISQHIGDLETEAAYNAFRHVIQSLQTLYEVQPQQIICDAHPDYLSTQYARASNLPVKSVQHHAAHVFSCMAENELTPPVLGISWDGTGYGPNGTVWGGEFILVTEDHWERVGHLRTFSLPGGEKAVKEPRRSALGLLYELAGEQVFETYPLPCWSEFSPAEKKLLLQMLEKGINSPRTSSMGRLFDAVAAICGLRFINRFEGQAAMELEFTLPECMSDAVYPFELVPEKKTGKNVIFLIDWAKMIDDLLADVQAHLPVGEISRKFHNTLAEMIIAAAKRTAIEKVALSGGCFQNKYLSERTIRRLSEEGFQPYFHQRVPPNDGGIALGQVMGGKKVKGKR